MELKDAFKELERFAAARARGATVVFVNHSMGGRTLICAHDGETPGHTINVRDITRGWTIKEIIEPQVLRDWTAEDAKKHIGFAYRLLSGEVTLIGFSADGRSATEGGYWSNWPGKYAAPIPGTDPAKWDWKPCKVEVAAEPPKPKLDVLATLRKLKDDILSGAILADVYNQNFVDAPTAIAGRLDVIIKNLESL